MGLCKKTKIYFLFLVIFFSQQCRRQTSFIQETVDSKSLLGDPAERVFDLGCEDEAKGKTFNLQNDISYYEFKIVPDCPPVSDVKSKKNVIQHGVFLILLDITDSMENTLKVIKDNLVYFSKSLKENSWEAKIGVIAYADYSYEWRVAEFSDAEDLAMNMRNWTTVPGEDFQEAGQEALLLGLEKVKAFKNNVSEQEIKDASVHVIWISDAISYSNIESRNDFSTTRLEKEVQQYKPFNLYYALSDFDPSAKLKLEGATSAKSQISNFAKNAQIPSQSFDYPISDSFFANFAGKFQAKSMFVGNLCRIKKLELYTVISKTKIPEGKIKDNVYNSLLKDPMISFDSFSDKQTDKLKLKINRCCYDNEKLKDIEGSDCEEEQRVIYLNFNS